MKMAESNSALRPSMARLISLPRSKPPFYQAALALCLAMNPMTGQAACDRWSALAMLESGGNDRAVGHAGEVSRYQIKPAVWSAALPRRNDPINPRAALVVAQAIMNKRSSTFEARFHRAPSDFEFYVLWNAPSQLIGSRGRTSISKAVATRAQRFCNLLGSRS